MCLTIQEQFPDCKQTVQVNASTLGNRLSEFKEFLIGGIQKFSP
jgi:hypothetical protein